MSFIKVTTAFMFWHYSKYSSHSIYITWPRKPNTVCIQEDYKITTYQFKSIYELNCRNMPVPFTCCKTHCIESITFLIWVSSSFISLFIIYLTNSGHFKYGYCPISVCRVLSMIHTKSDGIVFLLARNHG